MGHILRIWLKSCTPRSAKVTRGHARSKILNFQWTKFKFPSPKKINFSRVTVSIIRQAIEKFCNYNGSKKKI